VPPPGQRARAHPLGTADGQRCLSREGWLVNTNGCNGFDGGKASKQPTPRKQRLARPGDGSRDRGAQPPLTGHSGRTVLQGQDVVVA